MINFNDLFIFEMANNHQGDVQHGINIINAMGDIAKKHGVNGSVKLQYRQLDTFIHPDFRDNKEAKHISRFLSTELKPDQFFELVKAVKANGMTTICTPFDEASVDLIVEHGIEVIKVASCSADDWPLLEKITSTQKPIIASTGGLSMVQIDNLISFLSNRASKFAILHCVGIYPSPNHTLNLNFLGRLVKRYPDVTIGYSGHEAPDNTDVVKIAMAKGARVFERHVGLPTDAITLNNYSMNPAETDKWIEAALIAKEILGADKVITKAEEDSLLSLKRGVFARRNIKKGELIHDEDVFFAMPCAAGQLNSGEFGTYRAEFRASKDYKVNEAVYEKTSMDTYARLRRIIHDARGQMAEAGIVLNEHAEAELSHHYGLERFKEYGCLIVNLVNREYCKKIIVLFPGQKHPEQYHIKKEETFHVLKGELLATINGIERLLKKGEIITIERGDKHAFTSINGCIFEEVSTTHFRNDSFYSDPRIAEQDPMARKTVLSSIK